MLYFNSTGVTLSQTTNFRLFQTESVCALQTTISNLLKMAESSQNLVENTVGNGEIARYEQFLLFPQCLKKKNVVQTRKNRGLFGKGLRLIW